MDTLVAKNRPKCPSVRKLETIGVKRKKKMTDVTKCKPRELTSKKPGRDAGSEIDAFVQRSRALQSANRAQAQRGRLIFALDATASRQPTWDMAMHLQSEMFEEVSNLDVQLVYYRGCGECQASGWVASGERLANLMTKISCRAGKTQVAEVLAHARREAEKAKVTLLFIGDAMEENIDELVATAGELGRSGVKIFMFQEGTDAAVEQAFREIAWLSGGAYCRFDASAPRSWLNCCARSPPSRPAGSSKPWKPSQARQNSSNS
jgi:hypothetical protein